MSAADRLNALAEQRRRAAGEEQRRWAQVEAEVVETCRQLWAYAVFEAERIEAADFAVEAPVEPPLRWLWGDITSVAIEDQSPLFAFRHSREVEDDTGRHVRRVTRIVTELLTVHELRQLGSGSSGASPSPDALPEMVRNAIAGVLARNGWTLPSATDVDAARERVVRLVDEAEAEQEREQAAAAERTRRRIAQEADERRPEVVAAVAEAARRHFEQLGWPTARPHVVRARKRFRKKEIVESRHSLIGIPLTVADHTLAPSGQRHEHLMLVLGPGLPAAFTRQKSGHLAAPDPSLFLSDLPHAPAVGYLEVAHPVRAPMVRDAVNSYCRRHGLPPLPDERTS